MTDPARLLAAYDEQLRVEGEALGATSATRHGPLLLVTLAGCHGFVTYRDLGGADAAGIRRLVADALAHYQQDQGIEKVEWKTRGHDHAPGLHEALVDAGFVPEESESIMLGEARALVVDVELPADVTLRRVTEYADVRAMCAMQAEAFADDDFDDDMAEALLRRLADDNDGTELWVAEAEGMIVSAGRLDPVPDSDFAGIWGGATLVEWRGRGVYRALTAARARSALALGKTFIHSDSTEFSRPILERSGLMKVSTTTPDVWRRERA